MGFHEDDRIRNKNTCYTPQGITNNEIHLKLNNVSISDIVDLLTNSGYKIELEPNNTISVNKKHSNGGLIIHGGSTTVTL